MSEGGVERAEEVEEVDESPHVTFDIDRQSLRRRSMMRRAGTKLKSKSRRIALPRRWTNRADSELVDG